MAKLHYYESIDPQATPRKCADGECQKPATFWRYGYAKQGGVDRSSKQPVCAAHGPLNG